MPGYIFLEKKKKNRIKYCFQCCTISQDCGENIYSVLQWFFTALHALHS